MLKSCPVFKNRTSSLAVWPTLKNSTINLAPKIKIRKLPNIKPGFFQASFFREEKQKQKFREKLAFVCVKIFNQKN